MLLSRRSFVGMALAGNRPGAPGPGGGATDIVATTGMIADAARVIGGAPVRALMGPGLDPHSYRQTRSDIAALARPTSCSGMACISRRR